MLDPERARRLAHTALEVSTADETEVRVCQVEQELNRFTAEHPVQNQVRRLADVVVRVRVGGREGKASTGTPNDASIKRTVARAIEVAKHLPAAGDDVLEMPGAQEYRLRRRDPLTPEPDATADAVGRMTAACREAGCTAAGTQGVTNDLQLIANSRGLEVWDLDTRSEVSLTAFNGDGAGWASGFGALAPDLSADDVAARAIEKTLSSRDAVSVDPGAYTVVLEPAAVASLLLFAAYKGFGAQQIEEGSSFLAGRLGQRVARETVSIADDAFHPLAVGHVFDGEGMPRHPVTLIEDGFARNAVHDRATALKMGCRSTGHALPQPSMSGPLPQNLVLAPRGDDLLDGIDRGILVTEFHYTNMVEPVKLTLTGMTRNGTYLIENGKITRPVQNMRFTQSLVEALDRVSGLGSDARLCSALFGGYTVVPSLRIDGFNFSSQTEF